MVTETAACTVRSTVAVVGGPGTAWNQGVPSSNWHDGDTGQAGMGRTLWAGVTVANLANYTGSTHPEITASVK